MAVNPPDSILFMNLDNQGPYLINDDKGRPYASYSILDPVITVELLPTKPTTSQFDYALSARFNIQTAIHDFENENTGGFHARFFYSTALRYLHDGQERFIAEPVADPLGSFQVVDSSRTTYGTEVGLTGSSQPGASVRVHWTRDASSTVEQKLGTWSLTVNEKAQPGIQNIAHEWYWRGLQCKTNCLSPDHLQSVTRNIEVTRYIPKATLAHALGHTGAPVAPDIDKYFNFNFEIECNAGELGHGMRNTVPRFMSKLFCCGFWFCCEDNSWNCTDQLFNRRTNHGKLLHSPQPEQFSLVPPVGQLAMLPNTVPKSRTWTKKKKSLKEQESVVEMRLQNGEIAWSAVRLQYAGKENSKSIRCL